MSRTPSAWRPLAWLRRFLRDEDGPTAVEYAIMLALIIAACFATVSTVGGPTKSAFEHSRDEIVRTFPTPP